MKPRILLPVLTCTFLFLTVPNTSVGAGAKSNREKRRISDGTIVVDDPPALHKYFDNGLSGEGTN